MRKAAEAHRRTNRSKSTLFIFRGRRCEDGCIPYRKDQRLHGHVQLPSAGNVFDVERYMKRRPAIVKPDEPFDMYELNASDLEPDNNNSTKRKEK